MAPSSGNPGTTSLMVVPRVAKPAAPVSPNSAAAPASASRPGQERGTMAAPVRQTQTAASA